MNLQKILIVEDEEHLADGLRFNLEAEGYETVIAGDGETALEMIDHDLTAIVLDVMLPGISGFDVAAATRERGIYAPILMLTALGRPEDVVRGFESGADDYLSKPFDLSIFLARLNGLIRRRRWNETAQQDVPRSVIEINGRTFDLDELTITIGDDVLRLTLMESDLLRYLIDNAGRAVSRAEILEKVWRLNVDTDTRAIDNFIVRLRRHLGDTSNPPTIVETVRGIGYRFVR